VITTEQEAPGIIKQIGNVIDMERKQWIRLESQLINRRILITNSQLNGKKLGELQLRKLYGINITRIGRWVLNCWRLLRFLCKWVIQ
jgi:putative transport protein